MGDEITYDFINQEITLLRGKPYVDLVAKIGKAEHKEFVAHDGNRYQLETEVFWDSKKGSDIRVTVCADGGGVYAFVPLCEAFVMAPDGTLL